MKQVYVVVSSMLLSFCSLSIQAQQTVATDTNVIVPPLVNFSGTLTDTNGRPGTSNVAVTFSLYSEQTGGAALWMETQNVELDSRGHYTVMLGSTSSTGLPADIFVAGEAHWLGVRAQGQEEQPRVLLVSAPYALKAGDAQTLGGLPASAFVLAAPPSGAATSTAAAASTSAAATASISSDATSDVTTTGGTVNTLPLFSTATNIQNSLLTQTSTTAINVGGKLNLPATGTATASAGKDSRPQDFVASAFNSGTSTAVAQTFQLQAEPAGNDTATTSGTFNLLYGSGTSTPAETGFKISSKGLITFASGQTFPGTGDGTVTGVTAGTDLTGGGTGGKVTLNLNTAALNSTYARLGVANTFAPQQVIKGNGGNAIIGDPGCGSGFSGIGLTSSTLSGCLNYTMIGKSTGDLYVNSMSSGYIHFRNGNSGSNQYSDLATIDNAGNLTVAGTVVGAASSHGVLGSAPSVGVYGASSGASETGAGMCCAGVWGDVAGPGGDSIGGVVGSADNNNAGYFLNNSPFATVSAENDATASGSLVFETSGPGNNTCTIDIDATLTCNGQIINVVKADGGARKVSLYAMQSAENWFEDAGSGQLASGSAHITLDSTFAQTVNTGVEYHVFLTPKGDCEGLYVTNETPQGFEVHELRGGHSGIAFDYRIMAKRAGYENLRLADVTERYQKLKQQQQLRRERMAQLRAARAVSALPVPPPLNAEATLSPGKR
jgi:hypothetical protein